jgi:hypothetical protein
MAAKKSFNHLINKQDFMLPDRSRFSDREVNIALVIILVIIAMLFLVPLTGLIH